METNLTPLIEKSLVRRRFTRALASYDRQAVAQQHICRRLVSLAAGRLASLISPRVLEVGCGTGGFTRELLAAFRHAGVSPAEWVANDLTALCPPSLSALLSELPATYYLSGDAEQTEFPGTYDLVASASALQWFASPETFVRRAVRMLRPGGLLLFNTFGQRNLKEVKALTGKGLAYPSAEEVKGWLPPSVEARIETEVLTLRFPTPLDVLRHLKQTGVTATSTDSWTRGRLQQFSRDYIARYGNEREVTITYQPIYVLAVK